MGRAGHEWVMRMILWHDVPLSSTRLQPLCSQQVFRSTVPGYLALEIFLEVLFSIVSTVFQKFDAYRVKP
jgi:hypothetical protein